MKTYKIYYINLDKSENRRNFMEDQFKKVNVPITRFLAVYGRELDASYLKTAKKQHKILKHFPYLNDGEIGLTKTYFNLWKTITNQKEDFSIILEDDALLSKSFFKDLPKLLAEITPNDFIDISGRKGRFCLDKKNYLSTFIIPSLQTTGQIIGKNAAKILSENITKYYAPIDVIKQDVYKHKVKVYITNTQYVTSADKLIGGGSTIQQNKMVAYKKIIREIMRPLWQIISLITYKTYRAIRNFIFYKTA